MYLVDTILNSNVFAQRALKSAKRWSGRQMLFPIKYKKNTTGTSFSGMDTFSTSATDNRVNLTFDPAFYQITCALPLDELSTNQGSASEEQILDLAALELQSTAQDMADDIGSLLYKDGTGNATKDPLGLGAIVDDGTTTSTYGGLTRSTYTTLNSTVTASGGTLTLAKMDTLYNAVTSGAQKPTLGLTTEAIFALYGQLLQPQERIVKDVSTMKSGGDMTKEGTGFIGGTGFTGIYFKGVPILADEKASQFTGSATPLILLNENYINWYALPMAMTDPIKYKSEDVRGNDYGSVTGLGFSWSGWIKPSNQAAVVGHIYLGGQLISENSKRHGVLTGISGI